MNRVRIAHAGRAVEIDATDGPLTDVVAAAICAWHQTTPAGPDPKPPDAGGFGLHLALQPPHLELAQER